MLICSASVDLHLIRLELTILFVWSSLSYGCFTLKSITRNTAGAGRIALNTVGAAAPDGIDRNNGGAAAGEVTALCWATSPARVNFTC